MGFLSTLNATENIRSLCRERNIMFTSRIRGFASVSLAVLTLLSVAVIPASGTTYTPGVKAGDNVKYSNFNASWQSTDSTQRKPQFITDFQNTNFVLLGVQSVTGANVTAKLTWDFKNGTAERSQTLEGSVRYGGGNLTVAGFLPLLVAGGLGTTDKVEDMSNAPTFNSTITRTYAGASRDVNYLNVNQSSSGGGTSFSVHIQVYFDKITGVLLELSSTFSSTISTGTTTSSASLAATETSLWSATILGLSPLVFYGIIGAVIAVVVVVGAVLLMRRRKPIAAPVMPSTMGTPPASNR